MVQHFKGLGSSHWSIAKPFPLDEFKRLFLEWIICENIVLRQSVSPRLRMIFALLNNIAEQVIPTSHNTTRSWMTTAFSQEKITIQNLIANAGSRINISFDAWSSDNGLSLLGVVAHFLDGQNHQLKTILLGLPQLKSHHPSIRIS